MASGKRWIAGGILVTAAAVAGGLALAGAPKVEWPNVERPRPAPAYRQPALIAAVKPAAPAAPVPVAAPSPVPTSTPTPSAAPAAAAEPYVIHRVLDVPEPIAFGKWYWDESGAPAGRLVITVDLVANTISVFRAGYEIGTAAVMTGLYAKQTPLGVFPITQKDADHYSNIYKGAPMPYMLRLTNDGVSIHGGDVTAQGATHGCVGVPVAFAKKLFAVAKLGDAVIITRGERLALGGAVTAAK